MPAHRTFFLHFGRRMGLTRKPTRVPNDVSMGLSWVPRPGLTCLAALLAPWPPPVSVSLHFGGFLDICFCCFLRSRSWSLASPSVHSRAWIQTPSFYILRLLVAMAHPLSVLQEVRHGRIGPSFLQHGQQYKSSFRCALLK